MMKEMPDGTLDLPDEINIADLQLNASSACRNLDLLDKHNMELSGGFGNESGGFESGDDDPFAVPLPPPKLRTPLAKTKTTASLLQIYNILQEFGGSLNATPEEVRNTVVNKLLLELENPDPKIRLKAIELLGTVPGVDLFGTKRTLAEAPKTNAPAKDQLKERLKKLKESMEGVYESPVAPEEGDSDE
jgi:hypothetical protein